MTQPTRAELMAMMRGHWTLDDERWGSHTQVHDLSLRALDIATATLDKRVEGLNEFRAQLSQQANSFITRDLFDKSMNDMNRRFDELRVAITNIEKGDVKQEGRGLGQTGTIAAIISVIVVANIIIGLLIAVSKL